MTVEVVAKSWSTVAVERLAEPYAGVPLALILVVFGLILLKLHLSKGNDFDLTDSLRGANGDPDLTLMMLAGAWLAMTWWMVHETLRGTMTEGKIGIYAAAFVGPILADVWKRRRGEPVAGPTTVIEAKTATVENPK